MQTALHIAPFVQIHVCVIELARSAARCNQHIVVACFCFVGYRLFLVLFLLSMFLFGRIKSTSTLGVHFNVHVQRLSCASFDTDSISSFKKPSNSFTLLSIHFQLKYQDRCHTSSTDRLIRSSVFFSFLFRLLFDWPKGALGPNTIRAIGNSGFFFFLSKNHRLRSLFSNFFESISESTGRFLVCFFRILYLWVTGTGLKRQTFLDQQSSSQFRKKNAEYVLCHVFRVLWIRGLNLPGYVWFAAAFEESKFCAVSTVHSTAMPYAYQFSSLSQFIERLLLCFFFRLLTRSSKTCETLWKSVRIHRKTKYRPTKIQCIQKDEDNNNKKEHCAIFTHFSIVACSTYFDPFYFVNWTNRKKPVFPAWKKKLNEKR